MACAGSHDPRCQQALRARCGLDLLERVEEPVRLGFCASGTRIRKKVTGRTKAEVRDKVRELHQQVESGLRPRAPVHRGRRAGGLAGAWRGRAVGRIGI